MAVAGGDLCRLHLPGKREARSTGDEFERRVLRVLRLLGYNVERDVDVNGCQVDIVAEYTAGVISHPLLVECKEYGGKRVVGIEEANKFAGVLHAARSRGLIAKGLIVTTNGFSREARRFADSCGMDLVTFRDLSTQLIDFDSYAQRLVDDFEQSPTAGLYVDLSGSEEEDFEGADDSSFHRPLGGFVDLCLFEREHDRLALLGNFGTGKTTFCRKYACDLARRYQRDPSSRIPVLVNLSDFETKLDIQELITNTLQFRHGVRIDLTLCQELQRLGRFLLLFDGFDEMAVRVDPDVIRENLREIAKVGRIAENKFVLTCRTHFFRDRLHASILSGFDVVYIPEWGERELHEYLRKRFAKGWRERLDRIHGTHNLAELAQTPLFLEMIVQSLAKLGGEVNRTELYDAYTSAWIAKQSQRRGARLDAAARREFVRALSVKLYTEGKSVLHYRELTGLIREHLPQDDAAAIDYLRSDVRSCTFVTRDSGGNYAFRHKSFMEFFLAQVLAEKLREGDVGLLADKGAPLEVLDFLVEMLSLEPTSDFIKEAIVSAPDGVLRDNLLSIALKLGIDLSSFDLGDYGEEGLLLAKFVQGKVEAFEEIYRRHYAAVVVALRSLGAGDGTDEDIACSLFVRLWEKRGQFTFDRRFHFRDWLTTMAGNMYGDHLKRRRELSEVAALQAEREARIHEAARRGIWEQDPWGLLDTAPAPDEAFANAERERSMLIRLDDAIAQLTDEERAVVRGRYLEGMSASDLAESLGLGLSAIYAIGRRARKALGTLLRQQQREPDSME